MGGKKGEEADARASCPLQVRLLLFSLVQEQSRANRRNLTWTVREEDDSKPVSTACVDSNLAPRKQGTVEEERLCHRKTFSTCSET